MVAATGRVRGYDLADGSERWSVPGLADEPCITPVLGDGLVFVQAGGTVVEHRLKNETLRVDTGCLVALSSTAVVLKMLSSRNETNSPTGEVAVAYLTFRTSPS